MNWRFLTYIAVIVTSLTVNSLEAVAACSRQPDYRTPIADNAPREMTAPDPSGRDFQFYSRSVALIIGESNYISWRKLTSVPDEMSRLRAALEANQFEVFQFGDLRSDDLREVVRCFLTREIDRPEMRVLVFFAGHGATRDVSNQNVGYIIPIDAPPVHGKEDSETVAFKETAIPFSQFVQWAGDIEAKHVLFVFDSCFSGSVLDVRGDNVEKARDKSYVFSDVVQRPTREFLASGSGEQVVAEPSRFLQLFVDALMGVAHEADANRDGYVTSSELALYLKGFVPKYVTQTPVSGKLRDPRFDRGDFVFKLPAVAQARKIAKASTEPPVGYRTVFRGGAASAVKQVYEVEALATTRAITCAFDCAKTAPEYDLAVSVPSQFTQNGALDEVELRCISGGCEAFSIVNGPSLSNDRRSAKVKIKVWGGLSTWKLSATVLLQTNDTGKTPVFDETTQKVTSLNSTLVVNTAAAIKSTIISKPDVKLIFAALESDSAATRRSARSKLTSVLAQTTPEEIAALIRQIPTASYRYQLGLMTALAGLKSWNISDPLAMEIIASLAGDRTIDKTLRSAAKTALDKNLDKRLSDNVNSYFVYYEMGKWFAAPPLDDFPLAAKPAELTEDTDLRPSVATQLHRAPRSNSPVAVTINSRECVRVVRRPDSTMTKLSDWVQVVRSTCRR